MGVLNLPDEILSVGELGRFRALPIKGWDDVRDNIIKALCKSHSWDSRKLINTILSCYHNAGTWFSSLEVAVSTIDGWITGMHCTIPPHQLFTWRLDGVTVRGFIYVGPKIKLLPGTPVREVELENPLEYYNFIFNDMFSLYLNDDEISDFLGSPAETLYKGYQHGDSSF